MKTKRKMKSKRRTIGSLLVTGLVAVALVCAVCIPPITTTLAAGSSRTAIQIVSDDNSTGGISGYDSTNGYDYIYYGTWSGSPIKWRVLDTKTNMADSTTGDGLFLLSEDALAEITFNSSGNTWSGSYAQAWCTTFKTDVFSSIESSAILATTKTDNATGLLGTSSLNDDYVFFLSAEEVSNTTYGFSSSISDYDSNRKASYSNFAVKWWLRTPHQNNSSLAGIVHQWGHVVYNEVTKTDVAAGPAARPAFNLNLDSVLFTSAAEDGKSATGMDSGLTAVSSYSGSEWKLTLLDSSRTFAVSESSAKSASGDKVTLNYTGATTYDASSAPNEYISVIIADSVGTAKYYGRVAEPASASGTVDITIPSGLSSGTYTMYVFNEKYNGDKNTDYASAFSTVSLTVAEPASITTAPTANTLTYTGDAQALVTKGVASGGTMYYSLNGTDWSADIPTKTEADTYTVYYKVAGDSTHTDYTPTDNTVTVSIAAKSLSKSDFTVDVNDETYTGSEITKSIASGLTLGTDYTVTYADNTDIGTATITITGIGNYSGELAYTFSIVDLTEVTPTGEPDDNIETTTDGTNEGNTEGSTESNIETTTDGTNEGNTEGSTESNTESATESTSADTGDNTPLWLCWIMITMSGIGITCINVYRRRKHR